MERLKDEKKNHQECNMMKYNLYSLNDERNKILYQQLLLQKFGENASESVETFFLPLSAIRVLILYGLICWLSGSFDFVDSLTWLGPLQRGDPSRGFIRY